MSSWKMTARLALALALPGAACVPNTPAEHNVTTTLRPSPREGTGGSVTGTGEADTAVSGDDAEAADPGDADDDAGLDAPGEEDGPPASAGDAPPESRPEAGALASERPDAGAAEVTSDAIVVARQCSEVVCPALFEVTRQCSGHDSACRAEVKSTAPMTVTNYCHANGVKKLATTRYAGTTYRTSMRVLAAGGRGCYLLEMGTRPGSAVEHWLFRLWSGDVLARGSWNPTTGKSFLTCDGITYDVTSTDCPGTDGEPGPGECTKGACN